MLSSIQTHRSYVPFVFTSTEDPNGNMLVERFDLLSYVHYNMNIPMQCKYIYLLWYTYMILTRFALTTIICITDLYDN